MVKQDEIWDPDVDALMIRIIAQSYQLKFINKRKKTFY